MVDGKSETVLTGNLIVAKFNHDTNRNQEPQIHTHAVVINATQNGDKWQSLGTDTVGKTGFIENVYANQIAFGKIYREVLKPLVEGLGYETEVVGKHGMWEMKDVPVEPFSTRTQEINAAAGPDASLKSRDVATLDTRKAKETLDPAQKVTEWLSTLKETGFNLKEYREAADQRAKTQREVPSPEAPAGPNVDDIVTQAISGLSDRKVQFTYTELLARTVSQMEARPGVIETARAGIEAAIGREQLIPLDREKGFSPPGYMFSMNYPSEP
jgi:ATP-dependent exoDNAse (exonuclease V) alpha subunit